MSTTAPARFGALVLVWVCTAVAAVAAWRWARSPWAWAALAVFGVLGLRGLWDLIQPRHTLLRNYP
ncbi:putative glutamate synthase [NADPH] large chain, partial [Alcanivorax marinus]|nr:putative glutamate synthase [NADPH] large chain [Alloalcanivorax marinus]